MKLMPFDVAEFFKQKKGKFASTLYYFRNLDSTNQFAFELAKQKSEEGTMVLADEQTAGKGRSGRTWFSPSGVNLYFTTILRPPLQHLYYLPFTTALAVVRTLEKFGLHPDLKWPNDVLVNEKKICGILIQSSMEESQLQFAIVGCGMNVNVSEFPADLKHSATSIAVETGQENSRETILASLLFEFESLYEKISIMNWNQFCLELEQHSSYLRGCRVQIDQGQTTMEGLTCGLDSYGGLILDTGQERKIFYAGDIQSCRKK